MPTAKSPAEQNAVEVPLYTALDAARYLHVSIWIALSFSGRRTNPMELFERVWRVPQPRVRFADDYGPVLWGDEAHRISFRSLTTLFVASSVFRPMFAEDPFLWTHPEAAIHLFENSHEVSQGVADDPRLLTDPAWVLTRFAPILANFRSRAWEPDRGRLLKLIALYQSRVEVLDGVPVRCFPFSREPETGTPRSVVIDPELRFGRPTVKGVPTDVLVERWRAGDSAADLAVDYGLTTEDVEESLRYEATPCHSLFLATPVD